MSLYKESMVMSEVDYCCIFRTAMFRAIWSIITTLTSVSEVLRNLHIFAQIICSHYIKTNIYSHRWYKDASLDSISQSEIDEEEALENSLADAGLIELPSIFDHMLQDRLSYFILSLPFPNITIIFYAPIFSLPKLDFHQSAIYDQLVLGPSIVC